MNQKICCQNSEETSGSIIKNQLPTSDTTKLWRYMSIDKFVLMLLSNTLYIPSLKQFSDKKEGSLIEKIVNVFYGSATSPNLLPITQSCFYALCFHSLDHENELMWRAYAPEGGIALVTTVGQLKEASFQLDSNCCNKFYLLSVNYDYTSGRIHPIAAKTKEYAPENEYRMIFGWHNHYVKTNINFIEQNSLSPQDGINLMFNKDQFQQVFNEIWISPNHFTIIKQIVEKLTNTLEMNIPINNSNIIR